MHDEEVDGRFHIKNSMWSNKQNKTKQITASAAGRDIKMICLKVSMSLS